MADDMTTLEKIKRARVRLLNNQPFFGYLALRLRLREVKKDQFPPGTAGTTAVDFKGNFYYFPEFVESLNDDEREFVVAHEVMHLVLEHNIRFWGDITAEHEKFKVWNQAGDCVINDMLKQAGFKPPTDHISSEQPQLKKYKGKTTEEIYEDMLANRKLLKINAPCGGMVPQDNKGKDHMDNNGDKGNKKGQIETNGMTKEEIQKAQDEWKKSMIEAAVVAKQQGKLPGFLEGLIDAALEPPKVDWREQLFRFVQQDIPQDFTWIRPSKTSIATGYYLPATKKELIKLVVALDTSGSIGDDEYREFLSEMYQIARAFNHVQFIVISADAKVQHSFESTSIDEILEECSHVKGRGGTDFRPTFEWIEENVPDCKVLIYFTDTYGSFPEDIYSWHTIWTVTESGEGNIDSIPFGKVVVMEK